MYENNELNRGCGCNKKGVFQDISNCEKSNKNKCEKNDCSKEKGIKVYVDNCDDKGDCCFCEDGAFLTASSYQLANVTAIGGLVNISLPTSFDSDLRHFKDLGGGRYQAKECGWYNITNTYSTLLGIEVSGLGTTAVYVQRTCNGVAKGNAEPIVGTITNPRILNLPTPLLGINLLGTDTASACVYLEKGDMLYVDHVTKHRLANNETLNVDIASTYSFTATRVC